MLKNTKNEMNLNQTVIPAKRSASGNPAECKSTCHASLDGASHQIPAFAGMTESGRSMVEMLGVLAIVGVLSIAGVSGYTTAMKKHRANELLNEASKRAVVLAMKIAAGQDIDTGTPLAEFTDPSSDHTYTAETNPNNAKQFNIKISDVSKDVCEQMQAMMAGVIRGIECPTNDSGTATLTFNNDMSATAYASDYKNPDDCVSPFKWCSELGTNGQCIEGNDCCIGITTSDCLLCNINTGAITKPGNTQTCDFDGGTDNGKCDGNGNCVSAVPILYTTTLEVWEDANAMTDSERCPDGGHWASMDDLEEFGCTTQINSACTLPIETGPLWTSTLYEGLWSAYKLDWPDYADFTVTYDSTYNLGIVLCIK